MQNQDGVALAFANVLLYEAKDTTFLRGTITDDGGQYLFEKITSGNYLISVTSIGYGEYFSNPIELTGDMTKTLDPVQLSAGVTLTEVNVEGKRPPFENKIDRLVVNVENSVMSGGATALEILERSPGVVVDRQNNNISLVGKNGVNVMINGKLNYMPISALTQFLDGMPADNIKSIELITVPPANFDAEGNAGYINIILRKKIDEGLNGSFSVSYGYGNGSLSNNNLSLNYRKGKFNLFGSYGFLLNQRKQFVSTERHIQRPDLNEASLTDADRTPNVQNHNARFGVEYEVSDKTSIGGLFTFFNNHWQLNSFTTNQVLLNNQSKTLTEILTEENNIWEHFSGNINLKHQFSEQEYITVDLDFLDYDNENPAQYLTSILDGSNNVMEESLVSSGKITPIQIMVGKFDYHKTFNDHIKIDAGAKMVRSTFDNDVLVEIQEKDEMIVDPTLSSNSELGEEIIAAYTSADFKLGQKTSAKVGLRYEYTDSRLDTDTDGRVVDRQFGRLFPSAYLSHKFSQNFSSNISYSRRITRPTFNEMAPFVFLVDPTTFFAGNVALQPAFSDAFKVDLNYKTLFFSVQYTVQDSTIARFQQQYNPETDRLSYLSENLKDSKVLSFTVGFPVSLTKWWNIRTNGIYFIQENRSYLEGKLIKLEGDYFQVNHTQSFKLPKGFSSELSFFYIGPRISGTLKFEELYGLNIGLQKNFGEWGRIRLNVNDALNSIKLRGVASIEEQNLLSTGTWDFFERTYTLSYTRNFGNSKVKKVRKQNASEESGRVGN